MLTTPVVRQLKTQLPGARVHFATKPAYRGLLEANPYVDQLHLLSGSLGELVRELRAERFDFIVDLHNNLRTRLIRGQLPGVPGRAFDKLNWQKYLLVRFKLNCLPPPHRGPLPGGRRAIGHYRRRRGAGLLHSARPRGGRSGGPTPGFRPGHYVAVAIGAQHATKRLPLEKLVELIQNLGPAPRSAARWPGRRARWPSCSAGPAKFAHLLTYSLTHLQCLQGGFRCISRLRCCGRRSSW
ncbi:MAG: hypothetical protein WKG07_39350 [Hymenobacter sp.]